MKKNKFMIIKFKSSKILKNGEGFMKVYAPTVGQCFRKFFAMRPDGYEDIIDFKVLG